MRSEKKYLIEEVARHLKKSDYLLLTHFEKVTVAEIAVGLALVLLALPAAAQDGPWNHRVLLATSRDIRDAIDQFYGTGVEETLRAITSKADVENLEILTESKREEVYRFVRDQLDEGRQ